jgi:hypothetical protein
MPETIMAARTAEAALFHMTALLENPDLIIDRIGRGTTHGSANVKKPARSASSLRADVARRLIS